MVLRSATACLGLAFASGLVMAGIRFASDRASPPWLAKLHGFAAVAGLTLLLGGAAWFSGLSPSTVWALGLLGAAAASGLVLNLAYHWRQRPLPEGLLFAHMSLAFVGGLMVALEALTRAG
ncbi:MAG: hypothetical protein CFE45_05120 [Burkholderiales bacterium PBB5]|jgi:hypothetical protein|nr:MAG: hypothetical protein CFE45_05120 [Burkholderiales bacterium PBB5]